jgi:dihydroflavonol-4-reductase
MTGTAIYGDNVDVAKAPGGRLGENVWNTSSLLEHGAHSYSKTLAELLTSRSFAPP